MKPGNGRRAKAPCGHSGEMIIGPNFVRCLTCKDDSVAPPAPTAPLGICPKCGSSDVRLFCAEPWSSLNRACNPCGACWIDVEDEDDGS